MATFLVFSAFRRSTSIPDASNIAQRLPNRPHREPQDGTRGLQDGSRGSHDGSKRGPRRGARTDISSPRPLQVPIRGFQEAPRKSRRSPEETPRGHSRTLQEASTLLPMQRIPSALRRDPGGIHSNSDTRNRGTVAGLAAGSWISRHEPKSPTNLNSQSSRASTHCPRFVLLSFRCPLGGAPRFLPRLPAPLVCPRA